MKKSAQEEINIIIAKAVAECNKELKYVNPVRLRTCNARVYETKTFYVLQSYSTNVAIIDKRTHALYDFLRYVYGYTATSAQHISKFRHDYTPYPWNFPVYTWREI